MRQQQELLQNGGNGKKYKSFTRFFSKNRGVQRQGLWSRRARRETPARRNGRNPAPRTARNPQSSIAPSADGAIPGKAEGRRPHPVVGDGRRPFYAHSPQCMGDVIRCSAYGPRRPPPQGEAARTKALVVPSTLSLGASRGYWTPKSSMQRSMCCKSIRQTSKST